MTDYLLLIQQRFLNKTSLNSVCVAMRVADGNLVLLVEEQAAEAGVTQNGAAELEKMARSLVMRFATVPGIVGELHGDGDSPAALAPLPISGRDAPQISL